MRARSQAWSLRRGIGPAVASCGVLLAAQLTLDACITEPVVETVPTTIQAGTTSVSVDPDAFLHSIICSNQPGGMQSYVATVTATHTCYHDDECPSGVCHGLVQGRCAEGHEPLCTLPADCPLSLTCDGVCSNDPDNDHARLCVVDTDCAPDGGVAPYGACVVPTAGRCDPVTQPSSPPTSCTQSVFFDYVTPGDLLVAEVDGYEQAPADLVPLCGAAGTPCQSDTDCLTKRGSTCQAGVCTPPTCGTNGDFSCPDAYGCSAKCLVTNEETPSFDCLGMCGVDTNCLMQTACTATNSADYTTCALTCLQVPSSGAATAACLQANYGCLAADFPVIQDDCADPATSLPASGGVKQCNCTYTAVEGARQMLQRASQQPVSARWTMPAPAPPGQLSTPFRCGQGFGVNPGVDPACSSDGDCPGSSCLGGWCVPFAEQFVNVSVDPCPDLADHGGTASVTAIKVVPGAALSCPASCTQQNDPPPICSQCTVGGLVCQAPAPDGGTTGVVTGLNVIPADPSLSPPGPMPCSSTAAVTYSQGLVTSQSYAFTIQAYGAGNQVIASSMCFATPVFGLTVTAMCDPLVCAGDGGVCP